MPNQKGPCLDKNCSWCCDPVKIGYHKAHGYEEEKLEEAAKKIWKETGEVFTPESDSMAEVKTFTCENYDKETGKCIDYENRPEICRNTSCINPNSKKSVDEQYNEATKEKFFKINK